MRKFILGIALVMGILLYPLQIYTQESSRKENIARQKLYTEIFKVMNLNDPVSYVSFKPRIQSSLNEKNLQLRQLREKEGKYGFTAELNLFTPIPLFVKRAKYNYEDLTFRPFFHYTKLRLLHRAHLRVLNTESSRILPPTNSFGLDFQRVLFIRYNKKSHFKSIWTLEKELPIFIEKSNTVNNSFIVTYFTMRFMHYSNGQDGSALTTPIILKSIPKNFEPFLRNAYEDGNFSTNYLRLSLDFFYRLPNPGTTFGLQLGFQFDDNVDDDLLVFEPLQNNRYGKRRLFWMVQGVFPIGKELFRGQIHGRVRLEGEHILDKENNLRFFPYRDQLTRNSYRVLFDVYHDRLRSIGFFAAWYWGRDNLNIRYDDPVKMFYGGITINLNRYTIEFGDDH